MNKNAYRVLVVEDEVLLLENMIDKINATDMGYIVVGSAVNGREALEVCDRVLPDVVVTDIRMPLMDGLELVGQLAQKYVGIKKVIVSGYSEFEYAREAMRYNVQDYLLKPVQEAELRETLLKIRLNIDQKRHDTSKYLGSISEQLTLEQVVKCVNDYIRNNFRGDIDINKMMSEFYYSQDYINRLFISRYDESPSKLQIRLRMKEAEKLLITLPELSVRQIAEAVGYEDQSYFSRIFKKYTATSPLMYRRDNEII